MRITLILLLLSFFNLKVLAQSKDSIPQMGSSTDLLYDKIDAQQRMIDSLTLLVIKQDNEADITINLEEEYDDKELVSVGKMALKFDQAVFFSDQESKVDDIRAFFLPKFAANMVTLKKSGEGEIALVTHENFDDFVREKILLDKSSYNIINIDFLDVEVVNDRFTVTYKTKVKYYIDGEHVADQSILSTLTGKKQDGLWKIGSFFRTAFEYSPK